jgi:autotransporter-associated beta strand protein
MLITSNATFGGLPSSAGTIANGAGTGNSGIIDLGGATRTLDIINVTSGVDLAVNVPITNGGLDKTGAGTLALNAANTYSGSTTIQAGRIELGGSLNGSVAAIGGVLALGTGTGVRTVHGSLAVNAGGTLRVRLNGTTAGTEYDQLRLTNLASTVTLGGRLDLIATSGLATGSSFRIVDTPGVPAGVTGTFAGLPPNSEFYEAGQWWRISYAGGTWQ